MILKCLVPDGPGPKTNATKAQRHKVFNSLLSFVSWCLRGNKKSFYKIYNFTIYQVCKKSFVNRSHPS